MMKKDFVKAAKWLCYFWSIVLLGISCFLIYLSFTGDSDKGRFQFIGVGMAIIGLILFFSTKYSQVIWGKIGLGVVLTISISGLLLSLTSGGGIDILSLLLLDVPILFLILKSKTGN